MRRMIYACLILAIYLSVSIGSGFAYASTTPAEDMKLANESIKQAIALANSGDLEKSQLQFKQFNAAWYTIEGGVKKQSGQAYHDIEDYMGQATFAFLQKTPDPLKVITALTKLRQINEQFISGGYASSGSQSNSSFQGSVSTLISILDQALLDIQKQNIAAALSNVESFREQWLTIEGAVIIQSNKAYHDAERDMVSAYALLSQASPDTEQAAATIRNMRDYLSPLAAKSNYNMLDAATIILREGFEALLVIVSLLAFLKKSGHNDKKKWIWTGVGVGLLISIILGTIIQVLFSAGAFGRNNFLIAGWTGIFAAVMLIYMSYWLHSKSNLSQWQQYIRTQGTKALATGSLFSLAFLSFLAVFREGTETVMFFIGMASSISLASLLSGIGIGVLVLAVIALLIIRIGFRIPIRPFFIISSIFVFYLCFKFTGMGIHSLQLADFIPSTQNSLLPAVDFLALYPTWQSFLPQIILVIAALFIVIWDASKEKRLAASQHESNQATQTKTKTI